jgi:prevent-host-death family protein
MPMPPKLDYTGQKATITMMELRKSPGDVIERVERGMEVTITKNGRSVAVLVPTATVIKSNGTFIGAKPLTFKLNLGGEYGIARP